MNEIFLFIIILLLLIVNVLLVVIIFRIIKKTTYLSRKQKDFLIFVIDIYIDYADELNVNTLEEHNMIVKGLQEIKEKHLI